MQEDSDSYAVSFCPSFSSYSSDKLADIAVKVSREALDEDELEAATIASSDQPTQQQLRPVKQQPPQNDAFEDDDNAVNDEDGEEFEFVPILQTDPDAAALCSNGEFFFDGQIREVFPVFNRDLLLNNDDDDQNHYRDQDRDHDVDDMAAAVAIPLRNLFLDDRDDPPSSSSSEADGLEGVPPGTYCVWAPQSKSPSPSGCKKSKSTGSSSKRWRLRDLLKRSHSDGKDSFVLLNPNSTAMKKREENNNNNNSSNNSQDSKGKKISQATGDNRQGNVAMKVKGKKEKLVSAHEAFYVRNKAMKEGDKRKSYLPYRQDLVGFFANVNGLSRNFPQFYS